MRTKPSYSLSAGLGFVSVILLVAKKLSKEVNMTRIGLIRHGSTQWNKAGRAQGLTDLPLDEEGRDQARLLAEHLVQEKWDVICASDLSRAQETAEIIATRLGLPKVEIVPELREMNAGQIEGTTEEERRSKWGNNWNKLELGLEHPDVGADRGSRCIEQIAKQHEGRNVLIVSHGILLRNALSRLVPELCQEMLLTNTSITMLNFENNVWNCEFYNFAEHLNKEQN